MPRQRPQQRGELDLWRGKDTSSDRRGEMLVMQVAAAAAIEIRGFFAKIAKRARDKRGGSPSALAHR